MDYNEIEEAIQVMASYLSENITFYQIVKEESKKYENSNGLMTLFMLIFSRLSIYVNEKCYKDISFKEKITKKKGKLKSSFELIKNANLKDYYIKKSLNELIKNTGIEYDIDLFITILKSIVVRVYSELEKEKLELKSKKDLIKEDELIETIMSIQIIKNLCENNYSHLYMMLKYIRESYFDSKEYNEEDLSEKIETFIGDLELISNFSKEILQELDCKERIYKSLEKPKNEKEAGIYLFAFKTILKNFPYEKSIIRSYYSILYRNKYENELYFYDSTELEIRDELLEALKKNKNIIRSSYSDTAIDLREAFLYEEKFCSHENIILFETLSNNMKTIIDYYKENPDLKEDLNKLIDGITYNAYDYEQVEIIDDSLDFLLKKLNCLDQSKGVKRITRIDPITAEEVREAIKFVVNNYMASKDFYDCLLELRDEYLWYGLNISRFRLVLIQMSNSLELKNIKEESKLKLIK